MRKIEIRLATGEQFCMLSGESPAEVVNSIELRFGNAEHEIKTKTGWQTISQIKEGKQCR